MNESAVKKLGWCASIMSVIMYVSYIFQIIANLQGHKGAWAQPAAATLNCLLWSIYALKSTPRQTALAFCNIPGIFLAGAAFLTSF